MDTDNRQRLIEAYYRAVDEGSYREFERLLTEDALHARPGQGVLKGGAAVREYYENEREATETNHRLNRQVHDDDLTLSLVEVSGETPEGGFFRPVIGQFTFDEETDHISSYRVYRGYADETDVTPGRES